MSCGFSSARRAYPRPSRAIAAGRMLVASTSADFVSSSSNSAPAADFRSMTMLRLLRLRPRNSGPRPCSPFGPSVRVESPPGASTLMTSAPRSPSICVAEGPMKTVVRSSTLMPDSGPENSVICFTSLGARQPPLAHSRCCLSPGCSWSSSRRDDHLSPPEQAVLQRGHAPADANADHRQQEDDTEHAIRLEAGSKHRQRLTKDMLGCEELRADHAEQRENEAEPEPIEDHRHGARQHEFKEDLAFACAECARQRDVIRIDAAAARHSRGQHDEKGEADADCDLGSESEAEPDDEQRRKRKARHRVQRGEDRVE